jgi:hypothetical protein
MCQPEKWRGTKKLNHSPPLDLVFFSELSDIESTLCFPFLFGAI